MGGFYGFVFIDLDFIFCCLIGRYGGVPSHLSSSYQYSSSLVEGKKGTFSHTPQLFSFHSLSPQSQSLLPNMEGGNDKKMNQEENMKSVFEDRSENEMRQLVNNIFDWKDHSDHLTSQFHQPSISSLNPNQKNKNEDEFHKISHSLYSSFLSHSSICFLSPLTSKNTIMSSSDGFYMKNDIFE